MSNPFEVNKVYGFNVYPVSLLGDDFKNVTVVSILNYRTAKRFADVDAIHRQVYSYLPAGTPDNPSMYDYIEVVTPLGASVVLGLPWINEATIEGVDSSRIVVTIDNASSTDVNRIRNALAQNGFKTISIEVLNPASSQ